LNVRDRGTKGSSPLTLPTIWRSSSARKN